MGLYLRHALIQTSIMLLAGYLAWIPATTVRGATDDNVVGFVLELSGTWLLDGKPPRKIAGGDKLLAGSSLKPEVTGAGSYIIVCLYTGKAERYEAAARLPGQVDATRRRSIWEAVMGRYRGGLVRASSRGTELLQYAVLRIQAGQIGLSPSMAELPAGRWQLQLASWAANPPDAAGAQQRLTVKHRVSWDPDDPSSAEIPVGEMQPGLYEMSVVSERSGSTIGDPAIVLLTLDETYEAKRAVFDEAVALTKSWDEKSRREVANRFLQTCLETLVE